MGSDEVSKEEEMEKSEETMMPGFSFSTAKRHINKQQSQSQSASSGGLNLIPGTIEIPEKSKKEKVRSLSAVAKALSSNQMGCRASDSQKSNAKFKLPKKFLNDRNGVDHASVPRKIRSAMKKRSQESVLTDSEKRNHKFSGKESPEKDGIKKSKKRRSPGWSTKQELTGPITKDEEEVVETLYALAGMFPDNGSNARSEPDCESLPDNSSVMQDQEESQSANATIEASGTTQDVGCEKISSLDDQNDFPESTKFLVVAHSTAPNINLQDMPMMVKSENGSKAVLHDSELSLEMGLNVPTQSQISHIGRQSDAEFQKTGGIDCKQEQHIIKYQKETEGPTLWSGLSPIVSAGISTSYLQAPDWLNTAICSTKQDLMGRCASGGKISQIAIHKNSWKRCAAHIHISHLIRSLEVPKRQAGKESELYESHQMRVHQRSKCGVVMEAQNLHWMRNGNSSAAGTVHSACMMNSHEIKNDILQQQSHYHDISQAPPTPDPGVYGSQKQSSNFLSLSTGGNELTVNENFNKGESKLQPLSKTQVPYFQSLQQQHGLMPIQSQYASSFLDQLPVVGPQVRLQQPHYYGTPLRGTHYNSTISYKQQHQSFWAVQLAAPGGSAVNCSIVRAQYPNWQSGRHEYSATNPCAQLFLPHSPASLGSKITSISEQQLFTLASSLTPSSRSRANGLDVHLPSSVCEESKGRFLSSGTSSLQLLCDERI